MIDQHSCKGEELDSWFVKSPKVKPLYSDTHKNAFRNHQAMESHSLVISIKINLFSERFH